MKKIVLLITATFLISITTFANLNIDNAKKIDLNQIELELVVFNLEVEANLTCMDAAISQANLLRATGQITSSEWFAMVIF